MGEVHYAKGTYVGVICNDRSVGKNNGKLIILMKYLCPNQ